MMSSNSSLNTDDLFDVKKDMFNYPLRPTTQFHTTKTKPIANYGNNLLTRGTELAFLQIMLETSS